MKALSLLPLFFIASSALAADALSPRAEALIAPVHQAYERVRREQASMPPAKDVAETLSRLEALDQAGREALQGIDLNGLDAAEHKQAMDAIWHEIDAQDLANQRTLKNLIPPEGWFRLSLYGKKTTTAAFLIVQHAVNDPALMRAVLAKMSALRAWGEVNGEDYALLYDRVALTFDHKPQRYGTQVGCVGGRIGPTNLEDPAHVDERRKAVGMRQTEAQYLKYFPSSC